MIKIISLVVLGGLIGAVVICRPEWLASNEFLKGFVNHEVLGLMAVILTVTLASVANIHMALNRLVVRRFKRNQDLKAAADGVKAELKDNAWYIFYGFVVTLIVLLVKGLNGELEIVVAISNGIVVWTLFLFIVCMYDIYRVIFGVIDLEMVVGDGEGDARDYGSDSPDLSDS